VVLLGKAKCQTSKNSSQFPDFCFLTSDLFNF